MKNCVLIICGVNFIPNLVFSFRSIGTRTGTDSKTNQDSKRVGKLTGSLGDRATEVEVQYRQAQKIGEGAFEREELC